VVVSAAVWANKEFDNEAIAKADTTAASGFTLNFFMCLISARHLFVIPVPASDPRYVRKPLAEINLPISVGLDGQNRCLGVICIQLKGIGTRGGNIDLRIDAVGTITTYL
jgi:hypothetical protein